MPPNLLILYPFRQENARKRKIAFEKQMVVSLRATEKGIPTRCYSEPFPDYGSFRGGALKCRGNLPVEWDRGTMAAHALLVNR